MLAKINNFVKSSLIIKKILWVFLIIFLGLYIFSIPAFSARTKYNVITYALMISSAIVVGLYCLFYSRLTFNKRMLIPLLFVFETLIGTTIHSHEYRHWLTIVLLFATLVVFYYGFCAIKNKRVIFKLISYSFLAFAMYFAYYYRVEILKINLNTPLGNHFDNVNTVSTYFSLGSSFFLYLAMTSKKKRELLYFLPSIVMVGLGLFTGSRHFIVTTSFTFIVTIIVGFKKRKWIALVTIGAVIALFFIVLQTPPLASLKERINRGITTLFGIGNSKLDPSVVQRTIWPQYGFSLGAKEMIFGYGAEGFALYSGIGTYSHNTYSELFCNFGLLGILIFSSIFLLSLILALRSKNRSINIVIIVVAFYFIKGFFGVYFTSKDAYIMMALIMFLTKDVYLGEYVGFTIRSSIDANELLEVTI